MVDGLNEYASKNIEETIAAHKNHIPVKTMDFLDTSIRGSLKSSIKFTINSDRIFRILVPKLYSSLLRGYWVTYSIIYNKKNHTKQNLKVTATANVAM